MSYPPRGAKRPAELGAPPEELFDGFEPSPVASASLAQVHRAVERGTGRRLAVKAQHPGLREASSSDLWAVSVAVKLVELLVPDFRLGFVLDELAPHLPLELDFLHEAMNLRRCADFFGTDTARLLRPRRRRVAMTFLPEALAMRARKPCLLRRFRLLG